MPIANLIRRLEAKKIPGKIFVSICRLIYKFFHTFKSIHVYVSVKVDL